MKNEETSAAVRTAPPRGFLIFHSLLLPFVHGTGIVSKIFLMIVSVVIPWASAS